MSNTILFLGFMEGFMAQKNACNGSNGNGPFSPKSRLWAALELDDYKGVRKALEGGAPINSQNGEYATPVIYVLQIRNKNWARITGLLIRHGADMRGSYGKKKSKIVPLDLLVQIDNMEELEVIEQYACGVLTA